MALVGENPLPDKPWSEYHAEMAKILREQRKEWEAQRYQPPGFARPVKTYPWSTSPDVNTVPYADIPAVSSPADDLASKLEDLIWRTNEDHNKSVRKLEARIVQLQSILVVRDDDITELKDGLELATNVLKEIYEELKYPITTGCDHQPELENLQDTILKTLRKLAVPNE